MQASIQMWINRQPHLTPIVHNSLWSFVDFKVDMHNIYIRARKDSAQQWTKLPFITTDDAIFIVLESWPPMWCNPDLVEMDRTRAQK